MALAARLDVHELAPGPDITFLSGNKPAGKRKAMTHDSSNAYDAIPYTNRSFSGTHPNVLATAATLLGIDPPGLENCRVLELGCGMGGNLLPMAVSFPEGQFVGIDLSKRQVDEGTQTVETLGLTNLSLKAMSITDVDESMGSFDYILCHGVYSWVPEPVREKILDICRRQLTPNGVAYISYNVYPGWHIRGMIRDMLRYHVRSFSDPREQISQARGFLQFLVKAAPKHKESYARLLQDELEIVNEAPDTYLFHEHLEDVNQPVYFQDFMAHAAAHSLDYLCEAKLSDSWEAGLPPEVTNVLENIAGDPIEAQQYLDFVRNNGFRKSLLCHAGVKQHSTPAWHRVEKLLIGSSATPATDNPDIHGKSAVKFESRMGNLSTDEPILKSALLQLAEAWPKPLAYPELLNQARRRLTSNENEAREWEHRDHQVLGQSFLRAAISSDFFSLHVHPGNFTTSLSDRPLACPLARWQAAQGATLTNRLHRTIELGDPVTRLVLLSLDGEHDREQIVDDLCQRAEQGKIVLRKENVPVTDPEERRLMFARSLEQILDGLAKCAVLID
ncbi:MAG: methyltransferase regulatory domain-containing protein [Planctomycetota bacterium]